MHPDKIVTKNKCVTTWQDLITSPIAQNSKRIKTGINTLHNKLNRVFRTNENKELGKTVSILMSVMYGSAGLLALSYLSLSRGIVSCIYLFIIYIECTAIHNTHLWVPL